MPELLQEQINYFLQLFFGGLTRGSIYALLALGYSMIYGIVKLINFAHGEIYMIGAFAALISTVLLQLIGVSGFMLFILVIVIGVCVAMTFGYALERIAYRPIRNSPRLSLLITAIGMSIFLQNFVQLTQTSRFLPFPAELPESWSKFSITSFINDSATLLFNTEQIIIFSVAILVMVLLTLFVKFTALGKAMRAVSQDMVMSQLLGINVNKVITITFLIGSATAAIGSILISQYTGQINFFMGFFVGIKAFVAAVLGGIGSIPGAVFGSYLLGFVESFGAGYLSSSYEDVFAFLFLILALNFRPNGLFGSNAKDKV